MLASVKNRYANVIPKWSTRVKLKPGPGALHDDYINANYVHDRHGHAAYISTQAPVTHTLNDFWKMIWAENVKIIAMVTNLVEGGSRYIPMAYLPLFFK